MMRRTTAGLLVAGALLAALGVATFAVAGGGKSHVKSDELTGYREVTPAAVSSPGTGSFEARIDDDAQTISYELRYSGLTSPALQAHIHFGARHTSGGVSAFLCTNLGNGPAGTPPCGEGTSSQAVVTGTIDAADVVGPSGQGIAPGEFDELVQAIRAGVTYVNVHTAPFPAGEVRGQLNDSNQREP